MSPSSAEKPLIRGLTYPDVVQRSLYSMFEFGCSRVGRDAEAILYFGNRITYGELMDDVHAFAAGLVSLGLRR